MTEIVNGPNRYRVIKEVTEPGHYRLYLCEQEETGRQCLLQIATTVEYNGELQRSAYILEKLTLHAEKLEEEYKNVKTDPNALLNYQLGFPELVDSFIYQEQGGRQINILAFRNVENVKDMVPLINITVKNNSRIDLRTSAWIMGKALKMLDFVHAQGISVNLMTDKNILTNTQHYVVIFDWSKAQIYEQTVPRDIQCREISQAAQAVIVALGGNVKTEIFPENDSKEYIDYLLKLARGNMSGGAKKAHEDFYEIVDRTWEREFYPFTVEPLR